MMNELKDSGMKDGTSQLIYTSEQLDPGIVYTREDLRERFGIDDATLNTGVFQPKGTKSVWIFITEEKTSDRTQYRDRIEGDLLYCQGQTAGRKDRFLYTDHKALGLELLIFYRTKKYEHPGAGFRYLGEFDYVSHSGKLPADFVLRQVGSEATIIAEDADKSPYDPNNVEDTREKTMRAIKARRGQKQFRDSLINAYDGKCAISGCEVLDVLEAAHIDPYRGEASNAVTNGILLRADLHTLFDCKLIRIDPKTMTVIVDEKLSGSTYAAYDGLKIILPVAAHKSPSRRAIESKAASG